MASLQPLCHLEWREGRKVSRGVLYGKSLK